MIRNKTFSLILYISIFFLACIVVAALFMRTFLALGVGRALTGIGLGLAIIALVVLAFPGLYYFVRKKNIALSKWRFLVMLTLFTAAPRLIWVFSIDTAPISDFFSYHYFATKASNGIFTDFDGVFPLFPFKLGYPLIISIFYRIFGDSLIVAKLLHIGISVIVAVLTYWIGTKVFNERSGRIAAMVFALWPAQIMYNSVLASEHVFIVFFMIAVALFIKIKDRFESTWGYTAAFVIGIMLALANFTRPIAIIFFPIAFIYMFIFLKYREKTFLKTLANRGAIILIIFLGYIASMGVLNYSVEKVTNVSIWRSSSGFSLLIGTNYETSGMYSPDDAAIIKEFDYNFERVHNEASRRAVERIKSDPLKFAKLIAKKYVIQWGDEDFGYYWSTYELNKTSWLSKILENHFGKVVVFSNIFYVAIILLTIVGCIMALKRSVYIVAVFVLVFDALVAAHTFFEVQSRYHYPAIPFLILVAGYGASFCIEYIIRRTSKKMEIGSLNS